jgi:DNA-directed RNA polymerase subunit RPC12/RpoP
LRFRILAALAVLLLSAPSALGVQRALAPTRGDLAGWLAAVGIELAYLSLAFAAFEDQRRQRLAARVARAAVLTAIVLNVLADYAARVPAGLSGAAQFLASFDWLLLALSVLESAPLATLAYTLATLLHTHSSSHPHPQPDASHTASHTAHHTSHTDTHTDTHTSHTDTHTSHTDTHTSHTDTHTDTHTAHTDTHTAHPQRTASYRCPHCGAALVKQQQYAAALRYGRCGKCKGK